jgi:cell division protein FtsL
VTAGAFPRTAAGQLGAGRRTLPVIRPLAIFVLAVVVAFFAVIYARISLDRTAFELQRLNREIVAEQEHYWDLRVEYARLQSPERVTQRAAEIGLVYPEERRMIEVAGVTDTVGGPEVRWTEMRALFTEQP